MFSGPEYSNNTKDVIILSVVLLTFCGQREGFVQKNKRFKGEQ